MPKSKLLTAEALAQLGSERLAALLLDAAARDAALARTLRIAIASGSGAASVAAEIVRKHAGRQPAGWRFEFRHLHAKSASLSPFKRFAFELRDIAHRRALPGYRLAVHGGPNGREILVFVGTLSTRARGQAVDGLVPSENPAHVLSGTGPRSADDEVADAANSGIRREPELPRHEEIAPPPRPPVREFEPFEESR